MAKLTLRRTVSKGARPAGATAGKAQATKKKDVHQDDSTKAITVDGLLVCHAQCTSWALPLRSYLNLCRFDQINGIFQDPNLSLALSFGVVALAVLAYVFLA